MQIKSFCMKFILKRNFFTIEKKSGFNFLIINPKPSLYLLVNFLDNT